MVPPPDDLVLYRLDELKANLERVLKKQDEHGGQIVALCETVAVLKVKTSLRAALVGGISGALPAIGAALYWLLK